MALNQKFLCTKILAIFALGFLLIFPVHSISAEVYSGSEMRRLSRLIDQYGKHAIIDRVLKLRNGKITVEIEGLFKDAIGRPHYSYITPKSLLKDIHSAGLSVRQFAKMVLESVREKQQQERIAAEKKREAELQAKADSAAEAERERNRAARRRAFLEQYGDNGNSNRSSDANTNSQRKSSKRDSGPKTAVLKSGQIAAVSEAYLDQAYRFIEDDDPEALQGLMDAGNVFLMQQGIRVYVLDSKISRGRVKIRIEGTNIDLWAALASIQP